MSVINKISAAVFAVWRFIQTEILFPIPLLGANRRIHKKLHDFENEKTKDLDYMNGYEALSIERLKEYYKDSFETKKVIEDKLKTSLASLTLASAFILAFTNYFVSGFGKDSISIFDRLIISMMIFSILNFILAAVMAMETIGERNKIYSIFPKDEAIHLSKDSELKEMYAILTECNSLSNTIRQNFMNVSFKSIRNGIIATIMLPILFALGNSDHKQTDPNLTLVTAIAKVNTSLYQELEKMNQSIDTLSKIIENANYNRTNAICNKLDSIALKISCISKTNTPANKR